MYSLSERIPEIEITLNHLFFTMTQTLPDFRIRFAAGGITTGGFYERRLLVQNNPDSDAFFLLDYHII